MSDKASETTEKSITDCRLVRRNGEFNIEVTRWKKEKDGSRTQLGEDEVLEGVIPVMCQEKDLGDVDIKGGMTLRMNPNFEFIRKDARLRLPIGAELDPELPEKLAATDKFIDEWVGQKINKFYRKIYGGGGVPDGGDTPT